MSKFLPQLFSILCSIVISALILGGIVGAGLSIGGMHIEPFGPTKVPFSYSFLIGAVLGAIHGLLTGILYVLFADARNSLWADALAGVGSIAIILLAAVSIYSFFEQIEWSISSLIGSLIAGIIMYLVLLFFLVIPFSIIGIITGQAINFFKSFYPQ